MHPQTHVEINALTIRAPPDSITLPLPIPVHIPRPRNVFTKHDVEAAHTTASPPMLDQVHAHIKRGQLYAILGGSGSGKTTLLHAMAHRAPSNLIFDRERIRYFGQRSVCAFVAQEPKFLPLLTIRESIAYVAALKLPHIQAREREQLVQSTIDDLSLSEAASTRVRQCSGGEQRRLSIACALVANPGLVILDEATTGLDASTALQILILLKQLAQKQGKTIVISIHAPRTDAIKLFDRLLILTQGTVAFEGEMHRAVDWFESAGFTLPEHTNR